MRYRESCEGQDVGEDILQKVGGLGKVFLELHRLRVGLVVDFFKGELLVGGARHCGYAGLKWRAHY